MDLKKKGSGSFSSRRRPRPPARPDRHASSDQRFDLLAEAVVAEGLVLAGVGA